MCAQKSWHTMLIHTSYFDMVFQGVRGWYEFIDHCCIVILCRPIFAPVIIHLSLFFLVLFFLFDFPENGKENTITLSLLNMFDILKIRLVVLGNGFIKWWHKWRFSLLDWKLKMFQIKHAMLIPPCYLKLYMWNKIWRVYFLFIVFRFKMSHWKYKVVPIFFAH